MALKLNIGNINLPKLLLKLIDIRETDEYLYLKIDYISGNADSITLALMASVITEVMEEEIPIYNTRNIRVPVSNYSFSPDLQGQNFIEQGYEYLKTLPEFEGCEDC
ncbi:hypothetical protein AAW12_08750 [Sphingobacterium sp. Ag1]|uniref:hypothetical protein n=1 Tax=Sphingobacterium sp. Ag1 TaxID=1643451 RepID=UPI0006276B17|nr:hypothetical protein [Sphingobacterium sp. Ag1]KKO91741.1 hypothetical protein AAW12_08750 [Sphingobacterium sp. Ag1]